MSNLDSSDHRTLFHFETVHFKQALATGHDGASGPGSHMASFCMIEFYLASADGPADSAYRQWFLEVFLGPFSNVNDRIMLMSVSLRAQRPQASNKGLQPCPLCTEISPVSLNLLMTLCTVDHEICKAFVI